MSDAVAVAAISAFSVLGLFAGGLIYSIFKNDNTFTNKEEDENNPHYAYSGYHEHQARERANEVAKDIGEGRRRRSASRGRNKSRSKGTRKGTRKK